MDHTIRLDLERLRALPLDLPARLTLWRELRAQQRRAAQRPAGAAGALDDPLEDALRRLMLTDQLSRCRELALQGHWREASEQLTSLRDEAEALGLTDALDQLLLELLEPLQRRLLAAETDPSHTPDAGSAALHAEDRPELLWQAHTWLLLLRDRGLATDGHAAASAEPIARLGAVAWLERFRQAREPAERLRALVRSQTLLISVAEVHQPCPDWVELALRDGLRAGLIWLGRGLEPAELLRWSRAYVASVLPESQRQQARPLLWPAEAALEVGRGLRLEPFASS